VIQPAPHATDPVQEWTWQSPLGVAVVLGLIALWTLRLAYWSAHHEEPFSDMLDYARIGLAILRDGSFQHSPFWRTYKPPTVPLMVAAAFSLFGEPNLRAWQILQLVLVTTGLVWAAVEIARVTRRPWLAVALVWVVALSKSSVFWSLKLATEGVAEGLIYVCIGATLTAFRRGTLLAFLLLGALYTAAFLARPNFFAIVPAVFLLVGGWPVSAVRGRRARLLAALALGVLITWTPWLVRSYRLYGHVVPFSTQSPYSFLWELGDVTVTLDDGALETRNVSQLQAEAPARFASDYEAHIHARRFVSAWVAANWRSFPSLYLFRIERTLSDRTIYLTKLSREQLFAGPLNAVLIDKTPGASVVGIAGLVAMSIAWGRALAVVPILAIGPWLSGMCFVGYARIAEPSVPVFLFGNVVWVQLAVDWLRSGRG
jgi:hypothetical protein